jgi:hypothetical protein
VDTGTASDLTIETDRGQPDFMETGERDRRGKAQLKVCLFGEGIPPSPGCARRLDAQRRDHQVMGVLDRALRLVHALETCARPNSRTHPNVATSIELGRSDWMSAPTSWAAI